MKKHIKLQILGQDFHESRYFNSSDCVITRALKRAGYPTLQDAGGCICEQGSFDEIVDSKNPTYKALNLRVQGMYHTIGKCGLDEGMVGEYPADFEHDLIFETEYEFNQ